LDYKNKPTLETLTPRLPPLSLSLSLSSDLNLKTLNDAYASFSPVTLGQKETLAATPLVDHSISGIQETLIDGPLMA
jgi:hypothetical protein